MLSTNCRLGEKLGGGVEAVLAVDPKVMDATKSANGIPFSVLYDAFPMMKWAQPLGTPRAVLTNLEYVGTSTFARPLSLP